MKSSKLTNPRLAGVFGRIKLPQAVRVSKAVIVRISALAAIAATKASWALCFTTWFSFEPCIKPRPALRHALRPEPKPLKTTDLSIYLIVKQFIKSKAGKHGLHEVLRLE
ncbi:MAG: hypothetical protein ACJATW_001248 [Glaciecola sp.]|jgi:hypothetical protein